MAFEIEKGIPLPEMPKGKLSGLTAALRSMTPGDSLLVVDCKSSRVGAIISQLKELKFATRKVDGGRRIWRLE